MLQWLHDLIFGKPTKKQVTVPEPTKQGTGSEPAKKILVTNCQTCKKRFKLWYAVFTCNYCGKVNCFKHRLPEKHDCTGNPKSPSGALREVHHADGTITVSWGPSR